MKSDNARRSSSNRLVAPEISSSTPMAGVLSVGPASGGRDRQVHHAILLTNL
ncbi:hypothetical protein ACVOMT_08105 [Sphingomonas panni]